ncbi:MULTISPECIES: 7-cyano-7-deazaguanine synthase QueC [Silvimonas]|uniref:7-cyano-7-deazaguanine synthase QueC n=1 Tax=Silvimonas TaxID=300264 RepID=UPI0024B3A7B4|nr:MULTISPECIES: 7-cyano-7-deazaguanine synthase QueC [Silvimonas]MDR3429781.1 7-cyano-7-deazaguanine synthase QueC [Silvimonas sp.]
MTTQSSSLKPAVILLSGGLDSATCLAIAKSRGFAPYCLSFDYGQRHNAELKAAARVAKSLGAVEHRIIKIDLAVFGGSALTDAAIEVPTDGKTTENEIPVTYVPARNTILLSYALAWAEVLKSDDIYIGVNAVDYSGYPDCRPDYIAAYQQMARLATRTGVEGSPLTIHTPLITLSKAEIVQAGLALGVDYSQTVTCYKADEDGRACGQCDACRLRAAGFEAAGVADPTRYQG